ncbi:MAG TPA: tetratricopeptide repeat protein [Gaiellaceae bacterium]|jgi:tetratricopeptide (TPR) repeat protein|nr:tetratricopeptide repeat protein [Gaiellaceae bacterium]
MRRRLSLLGAAAALAAAALLFAGLHETGSGTAGAGVRELPPAPRDASSWARLGLSYEQKARETADPSYYTKAEGALRRALRLDRHDLAATTGFGSLALSRHRFREALGYGRRAQRLAPSSAAPYAVVGDALVELGRYDEAFRAFDTLARLKPGLTAYARVAYGRELVGDTTGAIQAMRLAAETAAGREPAAWTHWQLGKLYWSVGRSTEAASEYRAALTVLPGYVYALDALAQVEAGRGRVTRAISLERRAVDRVPLPQFVSVLGDLYRRAGRPRDARRQDGLVTVIERLLAANGVRTDLETALYRADRGIRPEETVALARLARRDRPSIDGDDALAWALFRGGRCDDALTYSQRSLRLGTRDALKFFHRGMIERCLGRRAAARAWFRRALALNPGFSVRWAAVARKELG